MNRKILFINACVRPESRTAALARTLLGRLDGSVEELRLADEHIPPLDAAGLAERDARSAARDFSAPMFRYARSLAACDELVIAAPYWDLCFPALLKCWLEAVCVCGVTFRYGPDNAPHTLCRAVRAHYVTTAGGYIGERNFGFAYVKALAETFFGISDIRFYAAEGLDIAGNDAGAILAAAQRKILE